ncbi:MAG: 50S ribosomal protein L4 [Bacteroidetes bacterium GWF2_42_66]|nr:MAG: 50S ribosomal protein L4 [Bacteroidetes bacterium GWA2_42_15]OFX99604.1 MAG: 50S ribosomal protein L4 [Bacteroidetes bacterium GWE2_42_39]OFY39577.1 MAG: 50S ribosomal protein L4 [Bacteroidetes bacterium GWF2_42_66]HBL73648.1 50S ribosomal protein L4 [Prolixibacteraceae bacterium]HCR88876.1 50S ribosomal protein L4 [Prolixibacteraceae bacterium]
MEIKVINKAGQETGRTVTLNEQIFGIEPSDHAIYLDVKQYMANKRQGTHSAKERGEVSYSTRKIKKQKGTGGARAGSIKSPVFRGGGRVFGPRPRNYGFKLNKKVKVLARISALSYKAKEDAIVVLEDFTFDAPKTREMVAISNNLKITDKKSLFVLPEENKNIYLSSRNLQGISVVTASDINTYQILNAKKLIVLESSVSKLEELLTI